MRTILGIDAAWTETQPSGVALLGYDGRDWKCLAVTPGYRSFEESARGTPVDWSHPAAPGRPNIARIAAAAAGIAGRLPDLVAVDMPLSTGAIVGRRAADDAISRAFGAHGCAVHTPSETRPGRLADNMRSTLGDLGYPLATAETAVGTSPALVEVYPHTALLALLDAEYRVKYKISKAYKWWPELSLVERRAKILSTWTRILAVLSETIHGIELALPADAASNAALKRQEDALDSLICAWVGIEYLAGRTTAYGDRIAAIWTPII